MVAKLVVQMVAELDHCEVADWVDRKAGERVSYAVEKKVAQMA